MNHIVRFKEVYLEDVKLLYRRRDRDFTINNNVGQRYLSDPFFVNSFNYTFVVFYVVFRVKFVSDDCIKSIAQQISYISSSTWTDVQRIELRST